MSRKSAWLPHETRDPEELRAEPQTTAFRRRSIDVESNPAFIDRETDDGAVPPERLGFADDQDRGVRAPRSSAPPRLSAVRGTNSTWQRATSSPLPTWLGDQGMPGDGFALHGPHQAALERVVAGHADAQGARRRLEGAWPAIP